MLKSIDKFQGRQVTLSGDEFVAATATAAAVPGSYSIEVEQLASAHKLQSTGAPSADAIIGTGTLLIATGGQNFEVLIDSSKQTLSGIAAAINDSAAGERVLATVITGSGEARLTLTARTLGAANALTITQSGGDGGLATLVYPPDGDDGLTQLTAALDAQASIDGVPVSSTTNTVSGAIAGVSITLKAANADAETTQITVGYDGGAARKTIDDLVKSYNVVIDALKNVSSFDPATRQGAPLFGDAGIRNLGHQLRRELTSNVAGLSGPFDMLGELGISADLAGKLSVNDTQLDAAFAADFDAIGDVFAAPDVGIATKLDKLLAPYLDTQGVFDARTAGLKSSIDDINDRREALSERLTALQARYTRQFNALDQLLGQLQGTSNFLQQQLSQLPGPAPLRRRD